MFSLHRWQAQLVILVSVTATSISFNEKVTADHWLSLGHARAHISREPMDTLRGIDAKPLDPIDAIGGITSNAVVSGTLAFVGVGLRLMAIDVSDPGQLHVVDQTAPFANLVRPLAQAESFIYVATSVEDAIPEIRIIKVSRSGQLSDVGSVGIEAGWNWEMVVEGQRGYLINADRFLVLDLSRPVNPRLLGKLEMPTAIADALRISGQYAYVARGDAGLSIIEISKPDELKEVNHIDLSVSAIAVQGETLYLATVGQSQFYPGQLRVFNITDPVTPVEMSVFDPGTFDGVIELEVDGPHLYASMTDRRIWVIDVSDPNDYTPVSTVKTPGGVSSLSLDDGRLYLATESGFRIIDVSTPDKPSEVGLYFTAGNTAAVAATQKTLFAPERNTGLSVIDISDKSPNRKVSRTFAPGATKMLTVHDGRAYMGIFGLPTEDNPAYQAMRVIDVSDVDQPRHLGSLEVGSTLVDIEIRGHYAYTVDDGAYLRVIDISNSNRLAEVAVIWPDGGSADVNGIDVVDQFAFIAAGEEGLIVIDISEPSNPQEISRIDTQGYTWDVSVDDQQAFVLNRYNEDDASSLAIIDIAEPAHPRVIRSMPIDDSRRLVVSHGLAYVTGSSALVTIIDISDPLAPRLLASHSRTRCIGRDIDVVGSRIFVAADRCGVLIFPDVRNRILYLPILQH